MNNPRVLSNPAASAPDRRVPYAELTLARFIAGAAERHGARTALICGGEAISYAVLHEYCRSLARGWLALGIERGARIAIRLGNSPDFVAAWYACGMAGAVAVPLSTYSTAAEIDELLRRSRAEILVTQRTLAKRRFIDELGARPPTLRHVVDTTPQSATSDASDGPLPLAEVIERGRRVTESALDARIESIGPEDEATILFSSGSTGAAKGIRHAQRAPVLQSWQSAEMLGLLCGRRIWTSYPFFWSAGLAIAMGGPLAAGAALALQPVFEPGAALDMIARESIEMLIVPAHVDVELAAEQRRQPRPLAALQRVRGGTQLLSAAGLPGEPEDLRSGYGLSEMFATVAYAPRGASAAKARGRLLAGSEVRIVDPVSGAQLAQGQSGEIAVRGTTLMLGYLDEPAERAFDADGFHRPGDIGHFDANGWLHWEGRSREMIRSRGANVAPVEIEGALAAWGGIKFGSAIGIPHPAFGEAIVVCGVRPERSRVTEADVLAGLSGRLAAYKLPQRVLFFAQSELDLTGTQKVRAAALRRLAARRIAEDDSDPAWAAHLKQTKESTMEEPK